MSKWGNGSHIPTLEEAKQLGRILTRVNRQMKRRCVTLVSNMNQPLGSTVGTGLELKETIDLLKDEGSEDLKELLLKLGTEVIRLGGIAGSKRSADITIQKHLEDGSALKKFKDMVSAQGGDVSLYR